MDVAAQGSAKAAAPESVTLQGLTAGKSRLEAARWFFETLVLQTKDFVDLQQVRPQRGLSEMVIHWLPGELRLRLSSQSAQCRLYPIESSALLSAERHQAGTRLDMYCRRLPNQPAAG